MNDIAIFETLRTKAGLSVSEVAELTGKHARTIRRYENNPDSEVPENIVDQLMARIAERERTTNENIGSYDFKFIDLFAGIGGLRRPFDDLNGKCVFTSEWDKFARETYGANFADGPDHISVGDIRSYSENPEISQHMIYC